MLKIITSFTHDIDQIQDKTIENLKEAIELGAKQFLRDRFRVRYSFFVFVIIK